MTSLIVANWKMNLSPLEARDLTVSLADRSADLSVTVCICPAFPYLSLVQGRLMRASFFLGAQDCSPYENGAHTGDVSARMLKDLGCSFVIVGHSERRVDHHETDTLVKSKADRVQAEGMTPIVCVGESLQDKEDGRTLEIIKHQLEGSLPLQKTFERLVIAYEPVWAIGTGKVPSLEEIREVHAFIRSFLKSISSDAAQCRLLYGGSVKANNASEILHLPDVNGVLVGGASLKAEEFLGICQA